jgi:hypothetical protein
LAAGSYAENLTLTRSVILAGAGSGSTVLSGQQAGTGVFIFGSAGGVDLRGLTIRGFHTGLMAAGPMTYLALTDVRLSGNAFGGGVNGVATVLIEGGGGDDTFFVSPTAVAQPGGNPLNYSGVKALTVDGGGGSNRLEIFLNDSTAPDTVWVTASGIARDLAPFLLYYRATTGTFGGGVAVVLGAIPGTVVVQGQQVGAPTTLYATGSSPLNVFNVTVTATSAYQNLTLDGGGGSATINVFDQSGGATIQNSLLPDGSGEIDVAYPSGALSRITYQNLLPALDSVFASGDFFEPL